MDPTPPNQSLTSPQKTSPSLDPATAQAVPLASPVTVHQITTELSAQASTLLAHQHQLDRLTDLTGQLVQALQGLQLTPPSTPPPAAPPVSTPPSGTQAFAASPRLAFPEKFDGSPAKCKGFLLQCSLFVSQQPHLYPTDEAKIAFVCSLLSGRALDWATAVWQLDQPTFPSFQAFLQRFKEVFQPSSENGEAGEQIMALKQGRRTVADYALTFRTLVAQSGWNDGPLKLHYRKGLNADLQVELACRYEGLPLQQYIDLSIRVDNIMRSRKPNRQFVTAPPPIPTVETAPEPMQIGATKLSVEERERRLQGNLCLYCGQPGHIRATCPLRPPRHRAAVSTDEPPLSRCEIPAVLGFGEVTINTTALIDSGAAGNFIDAAFVAANHVPVFSCSPHVTVAALDGRPLGSGKIQHITADLTLRIAPHHHETIRLFVISSPHSPIILGYPWLNLHEPTIAWNDRTITRWSPSCQRHCVQPGITSQPSPNPQTTTSSIPAEYQDLLEAFSRQGATQLSPHRPGDCAIDLIPGAAPPRGRIFPLSQAPSTSPASAGFFFVKKKDRGLRPCIDYRALNDLTIKYRYPLPLVPSALEQLRSAKTFTKLDLRSAYNLIRIRSGDEWKTAFSMTSGHYEYLVMPFGLANSPSYLQAFVNEVFRDMLNRWVIVHIDDILIYSNSYSEHITHVRATLQRLISHQLYAKEEKCEFHLDKISFLGYIISPEGVAMDEHKVNSVLNWPRPTTLKELQRFLGFSNFYRHFIRNFSSVAAPLTTMVKKGASCLTWSQSAIQAFDELRRRFTTAPILHHPDPDRPFIVEVDASSTGVGAVLSQRQGEPAKMFPCAFYSHKLSPAERNYDVGNRELLAIKLALEEWRHWLEGAKHSFTVLTDYKNLEYLRSAKLLNHRQARWALFFSRFDFSVTYRPGSQNTKADALSRLHEPDLPIGNPEPILPPSMILAPVTWDIMTEISEAQVQDPVPAECPPNLVYVPLALRPRLLAKVHNTPSSGHPGIEATLQLLGNRFWWPGQRTDTIQFITIDFVTDLPPSNGYTTILSIIDRFSKACRFIPLTKLPTAMETAELLCNWVFRLYGLPEDIVSDRGYHPQANGQVERLNQELTRFLRTYCHNQQDTWKYAQNSLRKPSTQLTPFQCILGFQPPLFPWSGEPSNLPAVNSWFQQSEETWNQAHIHLQSAIRRTRVQADHRRRPNPPYEVGQWVWLSTRDLHLRLPCRKLSPRYEGPFQIIKQITPVSFRLRLPPEYRISPTFHVSLLKPADIPEGVEILDETASQGPPPNIIDGKEVYQVKTLLDSWCRRGRLQYLVDWEGFGPEERSWVPATDILDPSLTADFHSSHPNRPAPSGRGRPQRRPPPRARSRSQGGGFVTGAVSVAPSNRRQREPSPEY
ncbi:Transposon Tf2-6 polyprotein [Labeo rohita]|uniref:Gypsy retrotransposon integrase-like protein 1 n=1 Tax=Labeo rohita TaxID=84645 RepID=A0ABQ8N1B1_LABRO|nr:Transposon Tf2-6 polyprotein [Labeo rohita]